MNPPLPTLIADLDARKADRRSEAAHRLAGLEHQAEDALPALHKRLKVEKVKAVRQDLLRALHTVTVAATSAAAWDPDAALEKARRIVTKGPPKALQDFPFSDLPPLTWKTGGKVPEVLLHGWIIRAFKAGHPHPDPQLRRPLAEVTPESAEPLGHQVLSIWMDEEFSASPGKVKGLLAITAACGGGAAGEPSRRFIEKGYKFRWNQCRDLIEMLSWIDHPDATRALTSIATGLPNARLRGLADEAVERVAQRRGWTVQDLADQQIPDARGHGKRALAAVVKKETARLLEAMCAQRSWRFAEWRSWLREHPVMGELCQSLVWAVIEKGRAIASFRPLDDGTFNTVDHDRLDVPPDATLRLAHTLTLGEDLAAAWIQNLLDDEIVPLFAQFRGAVASDLASDPKKHAVMDFEGHLIDALVLRGRAEARGFRRGRVDEGWLTSYTRDFSSLGLQMVLDFTGHLMREKERTAALLGFRFVPLGARGPGTATLRLSAVPPVLLHECWNDVQEISEAGEGFDAHWRQRV